MCKLLDLIESNLRTGDPPTGDDERRRRIASLWLERLLQLLWRSFEVQITSCPAVSAVRPYLRRRYGNQSERASDLQGQSVFNATINVYSLRHSNQRQAH